MKPPSKISLVASSPGRAEKLPAPPFSRLLKGKGGSRSRRSSSLSRASPMFMTRRKSGPAEVEKEPGSPKVTCIGQVRITKKKKKKKKLKNGAGGDELPPKEQLKRGVAEKTQKQDEQQQDVTGDQSGCCECQCFHPAGFCNPFTKLPKPKRSRGAAQQVQQGSNRSRRRMWRGWFSPRCCYSGRCRERKEQKQLLESDAVVEEDEAGSHAKQQKDFFARSPVRRDWMSKVAAAASEDGNAPEPTKEEQEEDCGTKAKDDDLAPTTPPKNALLLMRCRSAPQGAASPFARRILALEEATPHAADETTSKRIPETAAPAVVGSSGSVFFRAKIEESIKTAGGANDAGHGNVFPKPNECSRDSAANADAGSCTSEEADEDAAAVGPSTSFSSLPLILTRCQSAPAHKAAKLASTSAITPESSSRLWSVDNNNDDDDKGYYGGKSVEHAVLGRAR